jgi:diguanylate cyclase (GGDEF)-like protein
VESELSTQKVDQSFLDQFNVMQKSGALDDLSVLRNENRILDGLINDAAMLYALQSVEAIMKFVIDKVLQQFIPTFLLVAFEPPRGGGLMQYCYENLKPSEKRVSPDSFEILRSRFIDAPYPIDFARIELTPRAIVDLSRFDPAIVVPLCGIEGPYGVAILGNKVVGVPYSEVERMYIDKFTRFVSIGIQNNLHHESAITEPKTGLFNHSYFTQRVEQEIAHVARHGTKAGLIMLDVDHFKNFNDTWGHLAGDEVLITLAQTVKRTVRTEDVASRFGGEEFCVLAIECDSGQLQEMAERIRLAIQEMAVSFKSETLSVTASLGCCIIDPDLAIGCDAYVEMADKALYLSKSGGRNRSTLYRPRLLDRAQQVLERSG